VEACEEKSGGWNKPTDWIARFGSNFRVTEHTHLGGTDSREMLPWLRIAAELDPRQVNTYLVGSYWLRQVNKSAEAESFLREGLEANPRNSELLMELGRIYLQDRKNPERAHRLFELALQSWDEFERPKEKPDFILLSNIASNLARIEEEKGDLAAAIGHLERARQGSPYSEALARQIEEIKQRMASPAAPVSPAVK
jgi:tetratricopeptide (TPR) repeat protein